MVWRSGGGGDLYLTSDSDCNNPGFSNHDKASIKDLSQTLNYLAALSQFDTNTNSSCWCSTVE